MPKGRKRAGRIKGATNPKHGAAKRTLEPPKRFRTIGHRSDAIRQ
jgi:hypothetical protein